MVLKLPKVGFMHAQQLVREGHLVKDDRDAWSEHQASSQAENEFIREQGFVEYGKWASRRR